MDAKKELDLGLMPLGNARRPAEDLAAFRGGSSEGRLPPAYEKAAEGLGLSPLSPLSTARKPLRPRELSQEMFGHKAERADGSTGSATLPALAATGLQDPVKQSEAKAAVQDFVAVFLDTFHEHENLSYRQLAERLGQLVKDRDLATAKRFIDRLDKDLIVPLLNPDTTRGAPSTQVARIESALDRTYAALKEYQAHLDQSVTKQRTVIGRLRMLGPQVPVATGNKPSLTLGG